MTFQSQGVSPNCCLSSEPMRTKYGSFGTLNGREVTVEKEPVLVKNNWSFFNSIRSKVAGLIDPKSKFINSLLKVPIEERREFVHLLLPLISQNLNSLSTSQFIESIATCSDNTLSKTLIGKLDPSICSSENLKIIDILMGVPSYHRDTFSKELGLSIQKWVAHYHSELPADIAKAKFAREWLIGEIASTPISQRIERVKKIARTHLPQ